METLHYAFYLLVVFKVFDCEISCGIFVSDVFSLGYQAFDATDALFDLGSVIDMDVAGKVRVDLLVDSYYGVEKL